MTDVSGAGFDLARPDPAGTIQSLTSLGYTPAAAIADLIDNSIAAGARTVEVIIHWGGADGSVVAVCDDGAERFGISEQAVRRLVRKKALRALKFDGKLHFCERDLLVFEKRNATSRAVEP